MQFCLSHLCASAKWSLLRSYKGPYFELDAGDDAELEVVSEPIDVVFMPPFSVG